MKTSAHLSVVIAFSLIATPALAQRQQQESAATKAAGPAPRRDISGHWLGPVSPRKEPPPPMTALGQQLFAATKPLQGPRAVPIAQTNDPLVTCNPMGFPRSALFETRGFAFEHVPRRTLQLLQYQRIWREIWTDGRPLPTNVGAPGKDARDPRYTGIRSAGGPTTTRSSSQPPASTKTRGSMNVAIHAAWMRKSRSGTGGSITT